MTQLNLMNITSYYDLDVYQQQKVLLMVSKPKNFFVAYFNALPQARTCAECFNKINELHHEIWGEYMYSDWKSFSKVYKRYLDKRRK